MPTADPILSEDEQPKPTATPSRFMTQTAPTDATDQTTPPAGDEAKTWAIRLFNKSVLKQNKLANVTRRLGDTKGLRCLDIGADNGVISYYLRKAGGDWASGDLSPVAVESIRSLVETDVHLFDRERTPFQDDEFDRIVIVDFLEHIPHDRAFMVELRRILKDDGVLIVNCPHAKNSLLRWFRLKIGQTDEKHGHLRHGYTDETMRNLVDGLFAMEESWTYSKFFTEGLDTVITFAMGILRGKGHKDEGPSKGVLLTGQDMRKFKKAFRIYTIIYPFFRFMTWFDKLLFFRSGYCFTSRHRPL